MVTDPSGHVFFWGSFRLCSGPHTLLAGVREGAMPWKGAELYRKLLGLTTPWTVERVEMAVHAVKVDVYLRHAAGVTFACPECGTQSRVYDHAEERQGRHLDNCQFRTVLHARAPRVKCPTHGGAEGPASLDGDG